MNPALRDFAIRDIGCIASRRWREMCGLPPVWLPCEKHHLNAFDRHGGKRRGERYTVGLSKWSHVGHCLCGTQPLQRDCWVCKAEYGPSWHHHKREFIETFGDGDALLAYQERLIAEWRAKTMGATA